MKQVLNLTEILSKLKQNKEKISSFGIKRIGVFGSFVNEEQAAASDLDILIEFHEGVKGFDNYMGLLFFLEDFHYKQLHRAHCF